MSTTKQLTAWCRKNNVPFFLAVCATDELPARLPAQAFVIVNYQPSTMPGDHWVAFRKSGSHFDWFDSYGLQPDAEDLIVGDHAQFKRYLREQGAQSVTVNKIDLQQLHTQVCGHYCCWFGKNGQPSTSNAGWAPFGSMADKANNDRVIAQLVRL